MATALKRLATSTNNPPQRVDNPRTSECEAPTQRVGTAPPVTMTTNPTASRTLQTDPRTHQQVTRSNTPGTVPTIGRKEPKKRRSTRINPEETPAPIIFTSTPNSSCIPFISPRIISQEALNLFLTDQVWIAPDDAWIPREILEHSPKEQASKEMFYDVNIEHFCAAVVNPTIGKHITQYKK